MTSPKPKLALSSQLDGLQPDALSIAVEDTSEGMRVILSGSLTTHVPASDWVSLPSDWGQRRVIFDLKGLKFLDLNGASQLWDALEAAKQTASEVSSQGMPTDFIPIFELVAGALTGPLTPNPAKYSWFEGIGRATVDFKNEMVELTTFAGELVMEFCRVLRHPGSISWVRVVSIAESAGANAVPIVALVSFLVGLIIAFQSAMVLKMVGMEIFVAKMVGIAIVRELGPIIAAIVLAGRSGSAFSAELGAMKAAEEVNAITTMGLSPVRELALPRVLSMIISTPLVTIIGSFMGIMGGSVILLAMGYSVATYWAEAITMVSPATYVISIFKSFLFGFTVASISCQKGLAASDGPGAVGEATTSGVVANIVAITVIDSFLAVLFYVYDV